MEALWLLKDMGGRGVERDTITYMAAISACEKGGKCEYALRLHGGQGRGARHDHEGAFGALWQQATAAGSAPDALQHLSLRRCEYPRADEGRRAAGSGHRHCHECVLGGEAGVKRFMDSL